MTPPKERSWSSLSPCLVTLSRCLVTVVCMLSVPRLRSFGSRGLVGWRRGRQDQPRFGQPQMGSTVTSRCWKVKNGQTEHIVQLRHHNVSGRRILLVDGKETWNSLKVLDSGEKIRFNIGTKAGVVIIGVDYFTFTYECRFDGRPMPELTFDIMDHKEANIKASVPSVNIQNIRGKNVAVFTVQMEVKGESHVLRKRYRDFAIFDDYIRGGFDGHHLLSSLPKLPPKQNWLLVDHFSPAFLEERRQQLEIYIKRLVRIPKAVANPDFTAFFLRKKPTNDASITSASTIATAPATASTSASASGAPILIYSSTPGVMDKKTTQRSKTSEKKQEAKKIVDDDSDDNDDNDDEEDLDLVPAWPVPKPLPQAQDNENKEPPAWPLPKSLKTTASNVKSSQSATNTKSSREVTSPSKPLQVSAPNSTESTGKGLEGEDDIWKLIVEPGADGGEPGGDPGGEHGGEPGGEPSGDPGEGMVNVDL